MIGANAPVLADVSRETMQRLKTYAALVEKWTPKINLISNATVAQLWNRHFVDSAQIFSIVALPDAPTHWVDLGSGGGFPGLVIACLAAQSAPKLHVSLVESDQRKSVFLRTVIRETGVSATVRTERIEALDAQEADILSARALTDLPTLLAFSERHLAQDGTALFMKGARWKQELSAAQSAWSFSHQVIRSQTDEESVILKLKGVSRA